MSSSNRAVGPEQSDSFNVIRWDRWKADDAYSVHVALLGLEHLRPELKSSPAWELTRQHAYEVFCEAFEKVAG